MTRKAVLQMCSTSNLRLPSPPSCSSCMPSRAGGLSRTYGTHGHPEKLRSISSQAEAPAAAHDYAAEGDEREDCADRDDGNGYPAQRPAAHRHAQLAIVVAGAHLHEGWPQSAFPCNLCCAFWAITLSGTAMQATCPPHAHVDGEWVLYPDGGARRQWAVVLHIDKRCLRVGAHGSAVKVLSGRQVGRCQQRVRWACKVRHDSVSSAQGQVLGRAQETLGGTVHEWDGGGLRCCVQRNDVPLANTDSQTLALLSWAAAHSGSPKLFRPSSLSRLLMQASWV